MKLARSSKFSRPILTTLCLFCMTGGNAASVELVWGSTDSKDSLLHQFALISAQPATPGLQLPQNNTVLANTKHSLHLVDGTIDARQTSHARYNQYYQGLRVWGSQVVYHLSPGLQTTVTGNTVAGIDSDIPTVDSNISADQAKHIALAQYPTTGNINIEKIIYVDENQANRALVAYFIGYKTNTPQGPSLPHLIVDADTGAILQSWDALQHANVGQGRGGVTFNSLSYRSGQYQYGTFYTGLKSLGKTNVTVQGGSCTIANASFRVINLKNVPPDQLPFQVPLSTADIKKFNLVPFRYACTAPGYLNATDNGYAPVNGGLSPINDVTYFIQQSFNMYISHYGVPSPVGQLPLTLSTHVADYQNAFACGTQCMREVGIVGPQQMLFGNGGAAFAPLTDASVSGHELAHIVTGHFSDLIYEGQSGGINEAFADMAGIALENYIKTSYPWFWNGKDWTIGLDLSKDKIPLRYMNNPPLDGQSIDNAANYKPGMDVHLSSGIFNKAFYLISTSPGWTVDMAFRIMLDANMYYWTPSTTFTYGACGVIQSAYNRGYPLQDVIRAFQQVGVTCLVGIFPVINQ